MTQSKTEDKLERILAPFPRQAEALIPLLQKVQESFGKISAANIEAVAKYLRIPSAKVFGVVTFYAMFKLGD